MLQVEKRGRFITNMAIANFVTAAVESDDPRIKGTCMVILEEGDEGLFDRGAPTHKLVHQLSSTHDPIFSLKAPASRIVGGYSIQDGVIVPTYQHGEIIEAVFARTCVTVGMMTSAKLLSAVEPVIRYQRGRFRGGAGLEPGSPRYDLGIQQKEDAIQRLVDIWASGEARRLSLGFAAARVFDEYDPTHPAQGTHPGGAGHQRRPRPDVPRRQAAPGRAGVSGHVRLGTGDAQPRPIRGAGGGPARAVRHQGCAGECDAPGLQAVEHRPRHQRHARSVSLMGGYGITEDCPGFLGQKWMDAQLEATYEGPEAVQRRQLSVTMADDLFLAQFRQWIVDMKHLGAMRPQIGACAWARPWTSGYGPSSIFTKARTPTARPSTRASVTASVALADALCWLLATRSQILDVLELGRQRARQPDLGRRAGRVRELLHRPLPRAHGTGRRRSRAHLRGTGLRLQPPPRMGMRFDWQLQQGHRCRHARSGHARLLNVRGCHQGGTRRNPADARQGRPLRLPVGHRGLLVELKLDGCLTGTRLAKDRAAKAVTQVMIPEALDYPA